VLFTGRFWQHNATENNEQDSTDQQGDEPTSPHSRRTPVHVYLLAVVVVSAFGTHIGVPVCAVSSFCPHHTGPSTPSIPSHRPAYRLEVSRLAKF